MGFLERLFLPQREGSSDAAYHRAMGASGDLICQMRASTEPSSPARGIVADINRQRHNIPFLTSVYETVREMKAATTDHGK